MIRCMRLQRLQGVLHAGIVWFLVQEDTNLGLFIIKGKKKKVFHAFRQRQEVNLVLQM